MENEYCFDSFCSTFLGSFGFGMTLTLKCLKVDDCCMAKVCTLRECRRRHVSRVKPVGSSHLRGVESGAENEANTSSVTRSQPGSVWRAVLDNLGPPADDMEPRVSPEVKVQLWRRIIQWLLRDMRQMEISTHRILPNRTLIG